MAAKVSADTSNSCTIFSGISISLKFNGATFAELVPPAGVPLKALPLSALDVPRFTPVAFSL